MRGFVFYNYITVDPFIVPYKQIEPVKGSTMENFFIQVHFSNGLILFILGRRSGS